MNHTFLHFDKIFYKQIFGTSMGSPISLILANIVMQNLEQHVINSLDFYVHTYYHYVDDTFLIIPKDKIDCFEKIQCINSIKI